MGLILYENKLRGATASGVGTVSGNITNLIDGRTSTSEVFASGADREFTVDLGTTQQIDTLAISRNDLIVGGADLELSGSADDISYTPIDTYSPNDTRVNVVSFSPVSYRYYKVNITGHSADVFITDLAIGEAVILERDQKHGFIEPYYADNDKITSNVTRGK